MNIPIPTLIYRILHIDNLHIYLQRGGLHAPNSNPDDELEYKTIHNDEIQETRHQRSIPCGPGGVIHDYLPFYLGPRSPMLLQLNTGRVDGYNEGQEPLIYLVSSLQKLKELNLDYVFSDGHGIAAYTSWYDSDDKLSEVDWEAVYADYWSSDINDMDRQRRKQAECLVHQFCPWSAVQEIGVYTEKTKNDVERILKQSNITLPVSLKSNWYY